MYCHQCGSLLSDEVKFCPNCGTKAAELNVAISDSVELNVVCTGVDNELFANMQFDILVDNVLIGSIPWNGTTAYKITSGEHYVKIGAADILLNIPKEESFVTLDFVWEPNVGQRIVCRQNQAEANFPAPEMDVSQTASSKKQKMLFFGLPAIIVVSVVAAMAVTISSIYGDNVSSVSGQFQDKDSVEDDVIKTVNVSKQSSTAVDDAKVRKAYAEKVQELTAQDGNTLFSLIDLDGDDVLELVANHYGYDISVFTWKDGKIITLMDEWGYGVAGNNGYQYLPGRNVILNYDMDDRGAIIYENYWAVNKYNEVARISGETLVICHFNDINRNKICDEDEEYCDEPFYYHGDTEITEAEYMSYQFQGDYESISGDKTAEEMLRILNEEN